MKPVGIFRHFHTEGPGYFAIALERSRVPWRLVRLDAGEPVPEKPGAFSGIAFMGGPMSVNDEKKFPWLYDEKNFIEQAINEGKPAPVVAAR